jgi:hypothetical protein
MGKKCIYNNMQAEVKIVGTADVLDRIGATTEELVYARLVEVAVKEPQGRMWQLNRLASSSYFQDRTLKTAKTQADLIQLI